MISKLIDYKKQIIILSLWFPILFIINGKLVNILYFGSNIVANINAMRVFFFLFSFILLFSLFIINWKKIRLSNSIFFYYLLIFIIQSNFLFSENFGNLIINYKILFSGDTTNISNFTSTYTVGLEIQSIYMMIGSIAALLYYIIFNNKKYENILKIKITITTLVIATIYLYFTLNMMVEFFASKDTVLLYYSYYLSSTQVLGQTMSRSTGVSRILIMISIISFLLIIRYKNNYLTAFGIIFAILINSIVILLSSRFAIYAYLIVILSLFIFIKISYFKKFLFFISLLIIPYILQISIKEYKMHILIEQYKIDLDLEKNKIDLDLKKNKIDLDLKKNKIDLDLEKNKIDLDLKKNKIDLDLGKNKIDLDVIEFDGFINNIFNKNYHDQKKKFISKNNISIERELFKENSVAIETSGRTDIWTRLYRAILNGKVNVWIGNGFQADRKLLLLDDKPIKYYGSNVSSALLNIFLCSGMVGFLIFIYINLKILIRIYQLIFLEKIYLNFNANFSLIMSINIMLILYLRCLVENSISYFNLDFLIFLMCLFIIDKRKKII